MCFHEVNTTVWVVREYPNPKFRVLEFWGAVILGNDSQNPKFKLLELPDPFFC
jgi:hypothetical protein